MLLLLKGVELNRNGGDFIERLPPDQVRQPGPDRQKGLLIFHCIVALPPSPDLGSPPLALFDTKLQAWRKRWLVVEFPTCDSDEVGFFSSWFTLTNFDESQKRLVLLNQVLILFHQVRSSSLLIRVYVSHHHENKGPPAFCIPLLDVHGLHRIQSR